jgi:hypothetical protein
MGCVDSSRSNDYEAPLLSFEKSIGFGKWPTSEVAAVLYKYSFGSRINLNQLEAISHTLDISIAKHQPLLEVLQTHDSAELDLKKLLLLGILASAGSATDKALELFDLYDTQLTDQVTKVQLDELLDNLFYTCLEVLSSGQSSAYTSKCQMAVPYAKKYLSDCISHSQDFCTKAQFVDSWAKFRGGQLLCPSALRQYLWSVASPKASALEKIPKPLYVNLAS